MAKLFHVTCTLPNASNLINGIKFVAHEIIEGAVRTEEAVEAEVAAMFKGIKGYIIEDAKPKETKADKAAREAAEKADAEAKAKEEADAKAAEDAEAKKVAGKLDF